MIDQKDLIFTEFDDDNINEYLSQQILADNTFIFFEYSEIRLKKNKYKNNFPSELWTYIKDYENSPLFIDDVFVYHPLFIDKDTYMFLVLSGLINNSRPLDINEKFSQYAFYFEGSFERWMYCVVLRQDEEDSILRL